MVNLHMLEQLSTTHLSTSKSAPTSNTSSATSLASAPRILSFLDSPGSDIMTPTSIGQKTGSLSIHTYANRTAYEIIANAQCLASPHPRPYTPNRSQIHKSQCLSPHLRPYQPKQTQSASKS